jgi:hypothetical protein
MMDQWNDPNFQPGRVLKADDPATRASFARIVNALDAKGDAYFKMTTSAIQPDGTMAEGFDPITKRPKGPKNLTWNVVEFQRAFGQWKETQAALARWREAHPS